MRRLAPSFAFAAWSLCVAGISAPSSAATFGDLPTTMDIVDSSVFVTSTNPCGTAAVADPTGNRTAVDVPANANPTGGSRDEGTTTCADTLSGNLDETAAQDRPANAITPSTSSRQADSRFLSQLLNEPESPSGTLGRTEMERNRAALMAADPSGFAFATLARDSEGTFLRRLMGDFRAGFPVADRSTSNAQIPTVPLPAGVWMILTALAVLAGAGWFRNREPVDAARQRLSERGPRLLRAEGAEGGPK